METFLQISSLSSADVATSILEKYMRVQGAKLLVTSRPTDHMHEDRIFIVTVIYSLSPKDPEQGIHHGIDNGL